MHTRKRHVLAGLLIPFMAAACSLANAQILLGNGNFGGGAEGNVLVASPANSVFHIDASLNSAPPALDGVVNVDSTELISGSGMGQATFTPMDDVLNNICFSLKQNKVFGRFSFNPQGNGTGNGPYSVTVDWLDSMAVAGQTTFSPAGTLGNGENRFGLTASAGYYMTKVTFNSATGSDDGKQARILNVTDAPVPPPGVPEPGTLALIGAMGVPAAMMLRRRKR